MNRLETNYKIKEFLDGHNNDIKYLVNIETDSSTNEAVCFFHEPNGRKYQRIIQYEPFLYVKDLEKNGIDLYPGDMKHIESNKRVLYGIKIKKLRTDNQKRLEDGYCYRVSSTKSFNDILNYFKNGGLDIYQKQYDENDNVVMMGDMVYYKNKEYFYIIKPFEQFLISKGVRLYKGINEYKELHRVVFDIETTGLRYQSTNCFAIGIRDNRGYEEVIELDNKNEEEPEKKLIEKFFKRIVELEPAIVAGYNSEDFDFPYLLGRADKLGLNVTTDIQTTLRGDIPIKQTFGSLKYGGTTERYTANKIYGMSVIDILHAVKKTSAINTEIKNNKLKYICQFENIAKPNRVYIKGEDNGIGDMYNKNKIYITNRNFNYLEIPEEYQSVAKKMYVIQEYRRAKKIDNEQTIKLKRKTLNEDTTGFKKWYEENSIIDDRKYFITGKILLRRYLKDDLWETEQVDELYNQSSFMLAKIIPTTYERICTMGTAAIWELLLTAWSYENNLAIPHSDEKGSISGGLARCFKKGFSKDMMKIDYASLYPFIQLTHDVFPTFDITGVMKKILNYTTTTRNVYKKVGNLSKLENDEEEFFRVIDNDLYYKYKKNDISKKEINSSKVKQLPIKILNNTLFGGLGSDVAFKWSDNKCAWRITCIGRLYLRKATKWFNDYGCIPLLMVTDGINFQIPQKTNIRVTDNSVIKEDNYDLIDNMWSHGGAVGIKALINKYNKEEMIPPYMGIDDDGSAFSVLNLSRINYAMLFKENKGDGEIFDKIKLVGNTVKSKTMPEYIEEFLDKGLNMILNGKGKEFVDYYYDYVDDIFYRRIPLKKIASKSKMKNSIDSYLKRGKDKNGRVKAMQAHMELIINERKKIAKEIFIDKGAEIIGDVDSYSFQKYTFDDLLKYAKNDVEYLETLTDAKIKKFDKEINKIISDYMPPEPELDSTIYYYNNGYRKSHGDVKEIKDKETGIKRISSKLISTKELIDNPNMLGEYNVDKYLDAFNNRVGKFLVGFDESVQQRIPAKIKRTKTKNKLGVSVEHEELLKSTFTLDELKLKNFDLDYLEDSLYLEDKEIEFWNYYGYNPDKIWDGYKVNEGELRYDEYLEVLDFLNQKMIENNKKKIKNLDDDLINNDYVLIKEKSKYHIGLYSNELIKIIRYDVKVPKTSRQLKEEKENKIKDENLKKLKISEIRDVSKDEYYFKLFKSKFKLSDDINKLSMDEFFSVFNEAEKLFKDFIKEMEEKELIDYEIS